MVAGEYAAEFGWRKIVGTAPKWPRYWLTKLEDEESGEPHVTALEGCTEESSRGSQDSGAMRSVPGFTPGYL